MLNYCMLQYKTSVCSEGHKSAGCADVACGNIKVGLLFEGNTLIHHGSLGGVLSSLVTCCSDYQQLLEMKQDFLLKLV